MLEEAVQAVGVEDMEWCFFSFGQEELQETTRLLAWDQEESLVVEMDVRGRRGEQDGGEALQQFFSLGAAAASERG